MKLIGLTDWRRAFAASRKNGLEPQDVLGLLAFWQSNTSHFQCPLGAIHYALKTAEPRHRDTTWGEAFPLSAEAERLRRRAEREAQARQRAACTTPGVSDATRVRELRLRQLELEFEPILKGFANLGEVIARYQPPEAIAARLRPYSTQRWSRSLRASDDTRLALLEFLDSARN